MLIRMEGREIDKTETEAVSQTVRENVQEGEDKAGWGQGAQFLPHGSDLKQCPEGCEEENRPSGHGDAGLRTDKSPHGSHDPFSPEG